SHFLILLVNFAREGDRETRLYYQGLIDEQIAQRLVIKNRLGQAERLTEEDKVTYYSSWHYAAVHILVSVPGFQTRAAIAAHLGLTSVKTGEILEFLCGTGVLEQNGDHFRAG